MMLQPFLPSVAEEGEISLFMFNGALSHAVIKRAAAGDFRVQPQYGGQMTPYAPDEEARSLAEAALAVAPRRPVYARVDMARLPDGRLALMELEAVEPDLYFAFAPDGGEAFARAVLHALASPIAAS
jgi:glutathione synthase/RimK-type ligase-like ATP-grasp enzyme